MTVETLNDAFSTYTINKYCFRYGYIYVFNRQCFHIPRNIESEMFLAI